MKPFPIAAALACLSATPCLGQIDPAGEGPEFPEFRVFGEAATATDGEAIQGLMLQFAAAWGSGDAEAVVACYADDAEWTNAFGDVVRGSAELEGFLTRMFAEDEDEISAEEQTNARSISLRFLGDDVAVVHGVTISTRGNARSDMSERRVHTTFVAAKEGGTWQIVHQMIMDARE